MNILSTQEYLRNDDIFMLQEQVRGRCAMHAHEFIEIAYIAEGRGRQVLDGETMEVAAGDIFLLNAHVAHEFWGGGEKPLLVYNCIFQPRVLEGALQEGENGDHFVETAYVCLMRAIETGETAAVPTKTGGAVKKARQANGVQTSAAAGPLRQADSVQPDEAAGQTQETPRGYLRLQDGGCRPLRPLLEEMCAEFSRKEAGYRQMLRADLLRLLIACFRLYRRQPGRESAFARAVAERAASYLRANYARPVRCEELAARACLSVSYFNKLFKKAAGVTALQFLQRIRIEEAERLLAQTDLPVTEVARRVGYADVKYFYKLFGELQGSAPGNYRSAARQGE